MPPRKSSPKLAKKKVKKIFLPVPKSPFALFSIGEVREVFSTFDIETDFAIRFFIESKIDRLINNPNQQQIVQIIEPDIACPPQVFSTESGEGSNILNVQDLGDIGRTNLRNLLRHNQMVLEALRKTEREKIIEVLVLRKIYVINCVLKRGGLMDYERFLFPAMRLEPKTPEVECLIRIYSNLVTDFDGKRYRNWEYVLATVNVDSENFCDKDEYVVKFHQEPLANEPTGLYNIFNPYFTGNILLPGEYNQILEILGMEDSPERSRLLSYVPHDVIECLIRWSKRPDSPSLE